MEYISWKGDRLSRLCLGTVQFGLNYGIANKSGKPSQDTVANILDHTSLHGLNLLDTAQGYGDSEVSLGSYFAGRQTTFNIISKIKSDYLNFSNKTFNECVDVSLRKLGISRLFALLLHDCKQLHEWNNGMSNKVSSLKKQNKIKHFGASIYTDTEFQLAIENDDVEVIQIPFNLFDQRAIHKNWIKIAREKNKLLLIRSIYLQGLLLMDYDSLPEKLVGARKYLKQLDIICKEHAIDRATVAMSFVYFEAKEAILLFGCDTYEQAKENMLNYQNLILIPDEIKKIISKFSDISESVYNPSKWT